MHAIVGVAGACSEAENTSTQELHGEAKAAHDHPDPLIGQDSTWLNIVQRSMTRAKTKRPNDPQASSLFCQPACMSWYFAPSQRAYSGLAKWTGWLRQVLS
mmetsp:Transcript_32169/g.84329  ORF Transcript_32169/g.84329 Transcript_32169/m.84329 type:complete len:101 (-) Transcript_32169:533-835(-)|eukprot:CAMPEP_0115854452 /NCGR_PEP_ID=MMETSP0287-20121206/14032_1 /TAXON_ID=412157 /ORGANISM="Chrysochromulina rotalis, Strain UIO044" /LENGTH=100 /DNA_ID=CAMNT_0003308571 /DNA_START=500 /DNA_END=802 /DNA_ORIENTATION=-